MDTKPSTKEPSASVGNTKDRSTASGGTSCCCGPRNTAKEAPSTAPDKVTAEAKPALVREAAQDKSRGCCCG